MGQIRISFIPYGVGAVSPQPPIEVTLIIRPAGVRGGPDIRHRVTDPAGNFSLLLSPGDYAIWSLELNAPSLDSPGPVTLETGDLTQTPVIAPGFAVPAAGCSYAGRFSFSFYRLPPGSLLQQTAVAQQLVRELQLVRGVRLYFLPDTGSVVLPPVTVVQSGATPC